MQIDFQMAKTSLLTLLVVTTAALDVAFATYVYYPPCGPPRYLDYGGYRPVQKKYKVGAKIEYYCNNGYRLYGDSSSYCKYNRRSYWNSPTPICKR